MLVFLLLASLGILDAGYLSYIHLFGGQSCGQGFDCSYVLSSSYSRIFGVPLSALGLGVYLCLAFLALRVSDTQKRVDAALWIFYISLVGSFLALYLVCLQAFVIQHWCLFCLFSTIIIFSIFILNLWYRIANKGLKLLLKVPNWNFGPKVMLSLLILPTVIFLGIEQAIGIFSTNDVFSDPEVVAHIGDRTITLKEVDHGVRLGINQIEWKRYELRLLWLESELLSMEAEQQGLSLEQLSKKNVDDAVNVSEEEIQKLYEDNQDGQLASIPYEKVKGRLSSLLEAEKKRSKRQEFLVQLKQRHNVSFLLPEPLSIVLDDNPRQGPEKGPAEAALTIVIFTDFECPFCINAYQQVIGLQKRYPQDIRVVFRHFPLVMHKNAHIAASAATCAHLQGRFWPYADLLFKNQGKIERIKLFDYAEQVGLDMEIFKQCMDSGRGKGIVDADIAEGMEFGFNSVPMFFFNGHFVKGFLTPKQLQLFSDLYLPEPDKQEIKN